MTVSTDPQTFRRVLGHYPTGVCVITAMQANGKPAGMAAGSFGSVSLDPPLAEHQLPSRKAFASNAEDKLAGIPWRLSSTGLPILEDIVDWIDCDLHAVHEAGANFIVFGQSIRSTSSGRTSRCCSSRVATAGSHRSR